MKTLLEQKYEKQKELIQFLTTDYLDYSDTEGGKIETKLRSELASLESEIKALELQSSQTGEECYKRLQEIICNLEKIKFSELSSDQKILLQSISDLKEHVSQSPSEDKIMSAEDMAKQYCENNKSNCDGSYNYSILAVGLAYKQGFIDGKWSEMRSQSQRKVMTGAEIKKAYNRGYKDGLLTDKSEL